MQERNYNLESLYNDIFENVYPQFKTDKRGVLYNVIHRILEAEETQANEICNLLTIKENAYLQEDFEFTNRVHKTVKSRIPQLRNKHQEGDKEMKNWIILTACILVGALGCIKFLKDTKRQEGRRQPRDNRRPPEPENFTPIVPSQPITAALCLIVPAYVASDLKGKSRIDSDQIEQLIDNASYFLCTKVSDAELIRLAVTNENILEVSEQREVYIKIEINDAQEILDQKVPYILKRNLPTRSQGVIKEYVCLKNLSGLETFNRV